MNEVQDGLFAIEDPMPCNPHDITIERYTLTATLERAEREEAAARILSFSQQLNRWVGVSIHKLGEMMWEELEQCQRLSEAMRHNHEEFLRFETAMRKYRRFCILTLGVYAIFVGKPTSQFQDVPDFDMPCTGIFIYGPDHVVTGVRELVAGGMLKHVQEGEGKEALNVFFPTPALISVIMRKQKLMTA